MPCSHSTKVLPCPLPPVDTLSRDLNPSPGAAWGGRWGGDCRQAGGQGSAPLYYYEPCVCVSKCASQLKEVSRKACHTCNTHTHNFVNLSLMCYSPYLCPHSWPSRSKQPGIRLLPEQRKPVPPRPALLCAWPLTGTEWQQGLLAPLSRWWPDPSKRLAPGPSNQLAPKAEATAACAPQSGEP